MVAENLNNNMLPVGTTVHINPEDIKWEVQGDLISRDDVKKKIDKFIGYLDEDMIYRIKVAIDKVPSVEPRIEYGTDGQPYRLNISNGKEFERPQGEWLWLGDNPNPNHKWSCNKCGRGVKEQENFCPNCGADMRCAEND